MTDDKEDELLCLMATQFFQLEDVDTADEAVLNAVSILEEVKKRRQQLGKNK